MHSIWFDFVLTTSSSTPEAILVSHYFNCASFVLLSIILASSFLSMVFVFSGACSRIHDPKLKER